MKGFFQSIRFKILTYSVVIFGAFLISLAVALYQMFSVSQQQSFDSSLFNHAVDIGNATNLNFFGDVTVNPDAAEFGAKIFPFSLGLSLVQFRSVDGQMLLSSQGLGNSRLPLSRTTIQSALRREAVFETTILRGKKYRLITYPLQKPGVSILLLQVAAPLTSLEREKDQTRFLLQTFVFLALAAAGLSAYVIVTRSFQPVTRMIRKVQMIQPEDLSSRLSVPKEAELSELAITLNSLLERLEKAFESQEQFIADASHQLKTPLAIIRGELEVFQTRERSKEELEQLLSSTAEEVKTLTKTVDNLLLLARFQQGEFGKDGQLVRIDEIILETIETLVPLAKQKHIALGFDILPSSVEPSELERRGDAGLLRVMFFNIIENAIKYSPEGKSVDVVLRIEDGAMTVSVDDKGPGIAAPETGKIFERFHRADTTGNVPGVGLGLSIAQKIANLHNSLITLDSLDQGARFVIHIKNF